MNNPYPSIIHDAHELRALLAQHPALPVVVLADENSACEWFGWTYCSDVKARLCKLLDAENPYADEDFPVFSDENSFEDAVEDYWVDAMPDASEDEVDAKIKSEVEKYKPLWRQVIGIFATN